MPKSDCIQLLLLPINEANHNLVSFEFKSKFVPNCIDDPIDVGVDDDGDEDDVKRFKFCPLLEWFISGKAICGVGKFRFEAKNGAVASYLKRTIFKKS